MNTPWIGIPENYLDYAGFVYKITCKETKKAYIGRKYFFKKTGKGQVESDWADYLSSSSELKEDINKYGVDSFEFLVLYLGLTKVDVNYMEVKLQFEANVLYTKLEDGTPAYYNKNIMSKYFIPKDFGTPEYEQKCKNISEAIQKLYANPDYTHPMKGKVHPNKGKKLPQTGHQKNKNKIWYTNGNINILLKHGDVIPDEFKIGLTLRKKRVNTVYGRFVYEYNLNPKLCIICSNPIPVKKRHRLTCSTVCAKKSISIKSKLNYEKNPLNKDININEKATKTKQDKYDKGVGVKRWAIYLNTRLNLKIMSEKLNVPIQTIVYWTKKNEDITACYIKYCYNKSVTPVATLD